MAKIKSHKLDHSVKALPQQQVMALNYKCRPAVWEKGEVINVTVDVNHLGQASTQYRVMLERKSPKDRPLFLHIGDDGIEKYGD